MQAQLRNPDSRPIPPGWATHFDNQRRIWYYVDLRGAQPKSTFLHPDDEDDSSDDDVPPMRPLPRPLQLPTPVPPPQQLPPPPPQFQRPLPQRFPTPPPQQFPPSPQQSQTFPPEQFQHSTPAHFQPSALQQGQAHRPQPQPQYQPPQLQPQYQQPQPQYQQSQPQHQPPQPQYQHQTQPQYPTPPTNSTNTPFESVVRAQKARQLSAAQKLYASGNSVPTSQFSSPTSENGRQTNYSPYFQSSSTSSSPTVSPRDFDPSTFYATPFVSPSISSFPSPGGSSSSSSAPSPTSSNSESFGRKPRGARSQSFNTRPDSTYSFASLSSSANDNADDFRGRVLFQPAPPSSNSTPASNILNGSATVNGRHHRAATLPNNPPTHSPPSGVFMKPKETPNYSTTAQPLALSEVKQVTPAFQTPSDFRPRQYQQAPVLTHANTFPGMLPTSNITGLPPGAAMPAQIGLQYNPTPTAVAQISGMPVSAPAVPQTTTFMSPAQGPVQQPISGLPGVPVSQMSLPATSSQSPVQQLSPTQLSPTQPQTITGSPLTTEPRMSEAEIAAKKKRNKVIKKMGIGIGKAVLKGALGSVGVPPSVVEAGAGVVGAIATGVAEAQAANVAAEAAASAAATTLTAAAYSVASSPPSTSPLSSLHTVSPSPIISGMVGPQQSMNILPQLQPPSQSYEQIVANMNAQYMQHIPHQAPQQPLSLQIPQQIPSPPIVQQPTMASSDYASMASQIQAMQAQSQRQQQQLMLAQQQLAQQQIAMQRPNQGRTNAAAPARPGLGASVLSSVLGGATHAMVSGAIDYGMNGGATDGGATSSMFGDFTASMFDDS